MERLIARAVEQLRRNNRSMGIRMLETTAYIHGCFNLDREAIQDLMANEDFVEITPTFSKSDEIEIKFRKHDNDDD